MRKLIEARNITKKFPGTLALDNVNFNLLPNEIHAIAGENGAGKSTLMHILAGVHQPDSGELIIDGKPVNLRNPNHAQLEGISTVFQELALAPNMSVAENVYTNTQPTNGAGFIHFNDMFAETEKVLKFFGVDINPQKPLRDYNVAVQQIVEIARAIQRKARVLILDEPTSAIGEMETEKLLEILKTLCGNGVSIIYVSHKLNEVFAISDRITVLKDGKFVATCKTAETSPSDIVNMMVGREFSQLYPPHANLKETKALMKVRDISGAGFTNVSIEMNAGEVLGIFGLTGSGRTELARGLFGVEPISSGEIYVDDIPVKINNPQQAMNQGLAYIPEDRKQDGLFLDMSLKENTAAACLRDLSGQFLMHRTKEEELAQSSISKLGIKARSIDQPVSGLSGGNQQKVLFAKWLARHPKVLIADEPTRGVDVGAKSEIHALLRELADNGAAVTMISSELTEVLGMSDRIAVMREGHVVAVLDRNQATEEVVGALALGTDEYGCCAAERTPQN